MVAYSPRRQAMLKALRVSGGWLDRAALATMTGKDDLSPNDIHHLRDLENEGFIERRTAPSEGLRDKYEYRATGKTDTE